MKLIKPNAKYGKSWLEAMKEFKSEDRTGFWNYNGESKNVEDFVRIAKDHEKGKNLPKGWVPATTYWLIDNEKFIGHINIRHELNDFLMKVGGNIGYHIRQTERGKSYGTKILELCLPKAKKLGLKKVLITCDESNIASRKVIEKNGGQLENKIKHEDGYKLRYWINLD